MTKKKNHDDGPARSLLNKKMSFDGNHQNISGEVSIRGPVSVNVTSSSKNVPSTPLETTQRAKWKLVLDVCTLAAVLLYTSITAFQWRTTQQALDAARDANGLLEESIRARIIYKLTLEGSPTVGNFLTLKVHIENIGHALATVNPAFGFARYVNMPISAMEVTFTGEAAHLEPASTMDLYQKDETPLTKSFIDGIPTVTDTFPTNRPQKLTSYLYGTVKYETLGHEHEFEYCVYLVRKDSLISNIPQYKNDDFELRNCPQWNVFN